MHKNNGDHSLKCNKKTKLKKVEKKFKKPLDNLRRM
jgi:hypothetical protein